MLGRRARGGKAGGKAEQPRSTMRIVFDSSVLYDDLRFTLPYSRLLLQAARVGEVGVVVPEIVVLEAEKRFREKVDKRVRAAETSRRELRELGVEADVDLLRPARRGGM
jgi:hypothetical protein